MYRPHNQQTDEWNGSHHHPPSTSSPYTQPQQYPQSQRSYPTFSHRHYSSPYPYQESSSSFHYSPYHHHHPQHTYSTLSPSPMQQQTSSHLPPPQNETPTLQTSSMIKDIIQNGLEEIKKSIMDKMDSEIAALSLQIRNQNTSIKSVMDSFATLRVNQGLESSPVSNTASISLQGEGKKKRGGVRVAKFQSSSVGESKSSYHPYIQSPNDPPPLKHNSSHPNVTLGYQFESIEICNQWIKAQVFYVINVYLFSR